MQGAVWREVVARIPKKHHEKLGILTTVGIEITVQDFIAMEEHYMVVRGRLSGSSDTGRVYFVPFDQVVYVGILKTMMDYEVTEMFAPAGGQNPAAEVAPPAEEKPVSELPETEPEPEVEPIAAEPEPRTPATPVKFPNRAELLARIKSRSQQGPVPRPSSK